MVKVAMRVASASVFVHPSSSAIAATNSFFRMVSTFSEVSREMEFPAGETKALAQPTRAAMRATDRNSIMIKDIFYCEVEGLYEIRRIVWLSKQWR
mmetsp:Transcript_14482/g.36374  ORF Transcript_14482/g.36374 Transcript_14482/m.36374 type:complete len:96 (+) Transcript_14482:316-603(+)